MQSRPHYKIGIAGTGYIATGLFHLLHSTPGFSVSKVLTRRSVLRVDDMDPTYLTNSLGELVDHSNIVFESSGDDVTEADGDQPGCLARLKQEVEGTGFKPQAYVNLKGF